MCRLGSGSSGARSKNIRSVRDFCEPWACARAGPFANPFTNPKESACIRRQTQTTRGVHVTTTKTASLVHQYAAMTPNEFGKSIEPKWEVAGQLVGNVRTAVEKTKLTPLDE